MNKLKIPLLEIPAFAAANQQAAADIAVLRSIIEDSHLNGGDDSKRGGFPRAKGSGKARTQRQLEK